MPIVPIPPFVAAAARHEVLTNYRIQRECKALPVEAAGYVRDFAAGTLAHVAAQDMTTDGPSWIPAHTLARYLAADALYKQALKLRTRRNARALARSGS